MICDKSIPPKMYREYLVILILTKVHNDKVWMYEEIIKNDDNLESSLLTSILLKIRSLYKFC